MSIGGGYSGTGCIDCVVAIREGIRVMSGWYTGLRRLYTFNDFNNMR